MEIITQFLVDNAGTIITGALSIGIIGAFVIKANNVLKEVTELLTAVVVALSDKKLTADEVATIIKEAKDIPLAVKVALGKT